MMKLGVSIVAVCASAGAAHAFCGFYVSGSGGKMFNDATQVVLMRDGTRTVLAMQNAGAMRKMSKGDDAERPKKESVKIEAKFDVAEYQILILSATDSTGLE